jgi:hypothetical protein
MVDSARPARISQGRKHAMTRIHRSRSGPAGSTADPEWGRVDPAAGTWFPEMALELARNAEPGL